MSRRHVRVILFCLIAMTWACASRTPPPTGVPSPPTSKPDVPSPPAPVVEPVLPPPPPPPRPPTTADCAYYPQPQMIATVALGEPVNPANAPRPTNESDQLVFRQIYETLVRVDCREHVGPGLAAAWRRSVDGRTWIVTLRPDARFQDGTPVTAQEVLSIWSRDGVGGDLRPHVNRLVQSVIAVDDETLAIRLRSTRVNAPYALAHTDLAIAKPVSGAAWPMGTRSTQVTSDRASTMVTTASGASIRFLAPLGDPRDRLDEFVDLLITRDPAVLDYAATLPLFQSGPLAWQRTQVLLSPGRTPTSPALSEDARRTLASDAVRGEARDAVGPFWWQDLPDCEIAPPRAPEPGRRTSGRVVYDATDGAARDLAERLVGLDRRTYQRATGLTGEALALARRRGGDAGYVMSFDSRPLDPCRDLQIVMERTPWLDPRAIVPLVDTRVRAILRRDRSGITVEWDGGLLLAGADDQR